MKIGKVPNDVLQKIVLDKIRPIRSEVLIRPKIGEDCCALDFDKYACVLTTDPITGAVNEVGRLAVHISCNDIASCGVEPLGLMATILMPSGSREEELILVMDQLTETASSLNIEIIGGHTEITAAVNRCVIITTAVGRILKEKLISSSGAKAGDSILLTKTAGIEGTAIIAHDRETELAGKLGRELIDEAKAFIQQISVVKEGIIAGQFGVSSMHDVTEGGVLGAVWEVMEASGTGAVVYREQIPVAPATREICHFYGINPLKLISSGSMLITCSDGEGLAKVLKEQGIEAAVIGKVTLEKERILLDNGQENRIMQPDVDELYKVL